jgi:hypothetical protein
MKKNILLNVLIIGLIDVLMFTFANVKSYDVAGEEDVDINPLSIPYEFPGEEDIDINSLSVPFELLL